jgi:hypothetical protein
MMDDTVTHTSCAAHTSTVTLYDKIMQDDDHIAHVIEVTHSSDNGDDY